MSSDRHAKRHQLKTLLPYIRPYARGTLAGLALTIVANAFQAIGPLLIGRAIDAFRTPATAASELQRYALLIVIVTLVGGAARYGMRQLLNGISRRIENDIRTAFFDHLLRLDAGFFARNRTGDLMSRAVSDIGNIRMAIGPAVMYTVNTIAFSVFSLIAMVRIDLPLTLLSIVPMLLLAPLTLYFGNILHTRYESIQEQLGTVTTMIQENLSGVRIVRAYVQEAAQQREFERLNREYFDRNMRLARTEAVFDPLLTLLATLGLLIVLIVGGMHVIAGGLSVGEFVTFMYFVGMLTWPMIAIGWVTNLFQRGAASCARIQAILASEPDVAPPLQPARIAEVKGSIDFRNVSFRYAGTDRDVLSGVTFTIEAGQTAAIVGPTGSGKSTIVSLLTRRYDRNRGEIRLDDVDIREISFEQLRDTISVVPQDAFVFSETIADNIALGLPAGGGEDTEAIKKVAEIARLDEAVAEFPMGYQTRLGERGVNLSGGQRQRATLARALARDPRILVLDDALSAVDTHTEAGILRALRAVFRGRTALIISHRVTAVMNADVILVLDQGRIVERGTHAQLVEKRGLYATLLRRQLLEEELDDNATLSREAVNL
ncbi:MAG: ABC transporter ATP-binding protein [Gemmatimonadota bacterium]